MRDVYQEVTDRIITALEQGTVPWHRPWHDDKSGYATEPYNAVTGRPYNGINLLILGSLPYASLGYLTFKQGKELGGTVRKGEKGTGVVFWSFVKDEDDETKTIPIARLYTVFNIEQCDNLPQEKLKLPTPPQAANTTINALAAANSAIVRHGGNRAFYSPISDHIQMPSADAFKSEDHYQATLAHELTHWTGHNARCNREFGKRFGTEAYAFEELVAEIGSAFLCAQHNVTLDTLQHPAYIANWLQVLRGDKRAIFTAASKAKQATEYLNTPTETELAA